MVDIDLNISTMWSRWRASILLLTVSCWIAEHATPVTAALATTVTGAAAAASGSSHNYKINPKPCSVNGNEGTCMFVWECIKSEGQHVGMCMDQFMFGSCCSHNLTENVIPQNYYQMPGYRPKPTASNGGSKYKPPKPSTFVSSNGYTTIYRPNGSGTLVIRPSHNNHHQQSHHHHTYHQRPVSSSSSSSSSSTNNGLGSSSVSSGGAFVTGSNQFSQKPTEGTVNKHSSTMTTTLVQQSAAGAAGGGAAAIPDQAMAASVATGIFTTHWQATTEPSFITRTKPPKPNKPSKKPILSITNNIQSTVLKPKPSAKPTKQSTSSTSTTTTTTTTTTPRPTTRRTTTTTTTTTTTSTTTTTTTTTPRPTTSSSTSLTPEVSTSVIDVDEVSRPSISAYTTAPGRTTISAARNADCGVQTMGRPETRIVGGKNAPFGRWPWQVSVRRTSFFGFSSTHRCGGAVINDNWIATAGHCVDDLLTSQIRIRVGEYDFSHVQEQLPYIERAVARKVVHPKYNFFTYEFDLALVKLEQPLVFAPHISPICLPATDDLLIGENATVTGWGRLSEGGTLPSVLQEVSVPIVSNDRCKSMFLRAGRHEFIPDIFLCAGHETGGQDSCQGDSGGPLQVKGKDGHYFLAGIISWGIGCAEANLPGVCTRISKFVPWIMETVL
ncbi:serine proteinase stubble [Anopheles aquasalis]|uniref:serine proteinase stubble n=1 Tax=Anopheles aquasalis TaxID=42839 RepID=UPI00215ACF18|nr:serine proteinase stubble [Anopheles aquasalis]